MVKPDAGYKDLETYSHLSFQCPETYKVTVYRICYSFQTWNGIDNLEVVPSM